MNIFHKFIESEDGAVTVDWVVLTAAIMAFATVVGSTLQSPINTEVSQIATTITTTN